ncbi:thymidylate synthase [Firmicutes bacterium CAG:882]|jgi:uncharacterized YigZ family protein|nr:thymidylate synthase [Firmicutes bacterium CAG:882]
MAERVTFIKTGGGGYYEEKKSRFIAAVYSISSEEEAASYVEAARKKYWDARHNCYAFVIGDNNEIMRFSDDGEPSGTAGKPILEVIVGRGIHNCLIVVTRYFGGTLLGTGGLVRAYQKSSLDALCNSSIAVRTKGSRITVRTDYNSAGKLQYAAQKNEWMLENIIYEADVRLVLAVPEKMCERVIKEITEITSGKAQINEEKNIDIEEPIQPD